MQFPTIPDYKEALLYGSDTFATCQNLEPILDSYDDVYRIAGGFAVVFKMRDRETNKLYALKCFHKPKYNIIESYRSISQHLSSYNSPYLVNYKFLEKEIWVSNEICEESEFPVVLMDWVEGTTLREELKQAVADNNQKLLQKLSYHFDKMALWLLDQPFAHTDLKTENILVTLNKQLVLVDYDGMFVPDMQGQQAREEGTAGYKHPKRSSEQFNRHTDDFSILLISLALRLIAHDPGLYSMTKSDEHLLFTQTDLEEFRNSELWNVIWQKAKNDDGRCSVLVAIMQTALHNKDDQIILLPQSISSTLILGNKQDAKKISTILLCVFEDHSSTVWSVSFSPDGKYLASASEDHKMNIYDVESYELEDTYDAKKPVNSVSFNPDGEYLAFGDDHCTTKIYSLQQKQVKETFENNSERVWSVSFSQNEKYFASGSEDDTVNIYDAFYIYAESYKHLHKLEDHSDSVRCVCFSPQGSYFASAALDETVNLYDTTNFNLLYTFNDSDLVYSISFSPDEKYIAFGAASGQVKLYSIKTKTMIHAFKNHTERVSSVSFSPDGNYLASASDDQLVNLYDLDDYTLIHTFCDHTDGIQSVCFSPDGSYIASAGVDQKVRLYKIYFDRDQPYTMSERFKNIFVTQDAEWFNSPERRILWWDKLEEQWKKAFNQSVFHQADESTPSDYQLQRIFGLEELLVRGYSTNCEDIDFHLTNLSGVKNLTNLQRLFCWGNEITDLEPLKYLTNLTELYCSENYIESLVPLQELTNLEKLFFHNNTVEDLSPLADLVNLTHLHCENNEIVTLELLRDIKDNFIELICHSNPMFSDEIEEFTVQATEYYYRDVEDSIDDGDDEAVDDLPF